jgi:hypothetical protein
MVHNGAGAPPVFEGVSPAWIREQRIVGGEKQTTSTPSRARRPQETGGTPAPLLDGTSKLLSR